MEITITHNINLNAPALVDFFREAIATQTKGNSFVRTPGEVAAARAAATPSATPAAAEDAAVPAFLRNQQGAAAGEVAEARKPRAARAAKDAPAPVANTAPATARAGDDFSNPESWGEDEKKKKLEIVRTRLSDYSADKRFGMDGVFAILNKYGVDRITALPTNRYAEFKAELDAALAKPSVDPLA